MELSEFLHKIWPRKGGYVVSQCVTTDTGTRWKSLRLSSIDAAAQTIKAIDASGGTVYHACHSFGDWYEETDKHGKKRKKLRTQKNVVACRTLFDDLDCGENKAYTSKAEALQAVVGFARAIGLAPMIVDSGGGWHLYWPLTDDITPDEWLRLSALKRLTADHYGLKIDHEVDTDLARVLRPIGTHNRKRQEPRPVVLKFDAGPYTPQKVEQVFATYCDKHNLRPGAVKHDEDNLCDLSGGVEYPPASAYRIIERCPALADVAARRGDVTEPLWRAMLGVVKHTVEGEPLAHEWSTGHPEYNASETQAKLDNWATGPTLCSTIEKHSDACATCEQRGKVKSPIHLGYLEQTEPPHVEVKVGDDAASITPAHWPHGFHWDGRRLAKAVKNADGGYEYITFSRSLFYPVSRVCTEDGTWALSIRANPGTRHDRTFLISTKTVAEPQGLGAALAAYEVFTVGKNGRLLAMDYIQAYLASLQGAGVETITYSHFGWHGNEFVLGQTKISANEDVPVIPGKNIGSDLVGIDSVSGDINTWVDLVDAVYNRPGAEAYQFVICAAFASPLVAFTKSELWHGIPIALTGASGAGKTSAMAVACSMYGPPDKFLINGGENGSTLNAIIGRFSAMHNLPIILDEITGRTKEDIRDLLYGLSNGRTKIRMTSSGEPHPLNAGRWDMLSFISGNEELSEMLNGLSGNVAEATELRVFNFKIEDGIVDRVWGDLDVKTIVEQKLSNQYGHVGRVWLRFCAKNRDKITQLLQQEMSRMAPTCRAETQERFYYNTVAHAIVAGHIARKLNLVRFDIDALQAWAMAQIKLMREGRKMMSYTPQDYLAQYLASIHGRIIITKHYNDSRRAPAEHVEAMLENAKMKPCARMAIEDRRFLLAIPEFNDWCRERGISPSWMRKSLVDSGIIIERPGTNLGQRECLGRGTTLPLYRTRVYELDYAAVTGLETRGGASVIPLKPTQPAEQQNVG